MHSTSLITALSAVALVRASVPLIDGSIDGPVVPGTTGKLGNAAITEDNPAGVTYSAVLPNSNTTSIRGYVAGTSNANGTGINFNINLYGFPSESLGPFRKYLLSNGFQYSANVAWYSVPHPRPASALGWQLHRYFGPLGSLRSWRNPALRQYTASNMPGRRLGWQAWQHYYNPLPSHVRPPSSRSPTELSANTFIRFLDLYTSSATGIGSFFGNRSLVIHTSNTTRLTCANFTLVAGNETAAGPAPPATTTVAPFTGGAAAKLISTGAVVAGMMAFFL